SADRCSAGSCRAPGPPPNRAPPWRRRSSPDPPRTGRRRGRRVSGLWPWRSPETVYPLPPGFAQAPCQSLLLALLLRFLRRPPPLQHLRRQVGEAADQRPDLAQVVAQPLVGQLLEEEVLRQQE